MGWLDNITEGFQAMANADFGGDDGNAFREMQALTSSKVRSTRTDIVKGAKKAKALADKYAANDKAIQNRAQYWNTTDFEERERLNREYDAMDSADKDRADQFGEAVWAEEKQNWINDTRTKIAIAREQVRDNWRKGTIAEQDLFNEGFSATLETPEEQEYSFGKFGASMSPMLTGGLGRIKDNYERNSSYENGEGIGLSQVLLAENSKEALMNAIRKAPDDHTRMAIIQNYVDKAMENSVFGGDYEEKLDFINELLDEMQMGPMGSIGPAGDSNTWFYEKRGGEGFELAPGGARAMKPLGQLAGNAMQIVDLLCVGAGGPASNFKLLRAVTNPGYRRALNIGEKAAEAWAKNEALATKLVNGHIIGGEITTINGKVISNDALRVIREATLAGKAVDDVVLPGMSKQRLERAKTFAKDSGLVDEFGKLDMYDAAEQFSKMKGEYEATVVEKALKANIVEKASKSSSKATKAVKATSIAKPKENASESPIEAVKAEIVKQVEEDTGSTLSEGQKEIVLKDFESDPDWMEAIGHNPEAPGLSSYKGKGYATKGKPADYQATVEHAVEIPETERTVWNTPDSEFYFLDKHIPQEVQKSWAPEIKYTINRVRHSLLIDLAKEFENKAFKLLSFSDKIHEIMKRGIPYDAAKEIAFGMHSLGTKENPIGVKEANNLFARAVKASDPDVTERVKELMQKKLDSLLSGAKMTQADGRQLHSLTHDRRIEFMKDKVTAHIEGKGHDQQQWQMFMGTKEWDALVKKYESGKMTLKDFKAAVKERWMEFYTPPPKAVAEEAKKMSDNIKNVLEEAAKKKPKKKKTKLVTEGELIGDGSDFHNDGGEHFSMDDNSVAGGAFNENARIKKEKDELKELMIEQARENSKDTTKGASSITLFMNDMRKRSAAAIEANQERMRKIPYLIVSEWTNLVKKFDAAAFKSAEKAAAAKEIDHFFDTVLSPCMKRWEKENAPSSYNVMKKEDWHALASKDLDIIKANRDKGMNHAEAIQSWMLEHYYDDFMKSVMHEADKSGAWYVDEARELANNAIAVTQKQAQLKSAVDGSPLMSSRLGFKGVDVGADGWHNAKDVIEGLSEQAAKDVTAVKANTEEWFQAVHSMHVFDWLGQIIDDMGVKFEKNINAIMKNANGFFDPNSNTIHLDAQLKRAVWQETLKHEAIHAVTTEKWNDTLVNLFNPMCKEMKRMIDTNPAIKEVNIALINKAAKTLGLSKAETQRFIHCQNLMDIFKAVKLKMGIDKTTPAEWEKLFKLGAVPYGTYHPTEFIAEVMNLTKGTADLYKTLLDMNLSDVNFLIKNQKGLTKHGSVIETLIDCIKGFFGIRGRNNDGDALLKATINEVNQFASIKGTKEIWTSSGNALYSEVGVDFPKALKFLIDRGKVKPIEVGMLAKEANNAKGFNNEARKIVKSHITGFTPEYEKHLQEADFYAGLADWGGVNPISREAYGLSKVAQLTRSAEQMQKGTVKELAPGQKENYNLVVQRNPVAGPSDGVTRAKNEQAAREALEAGKEGPMPETGNTPQETILQETLPGHEVEQLSPNPGADWLTTVKAQGVDVIDDATKAARIEETTQYVQAVRNATHVNVTIDGTTENLRMVVSTKANTGHASIEAAKAQQKNVIADFAAYGIRPPEMNLVADTGDGVLRAVESEMPEGTKYYWQINHYTDLSGTLANTKEGSFANVTWSATNTFFEKIKEWVVSGSTWLSNNLTRAAYGGEEKAHGLLNKLFIEDGKKLKSMFNALPDKEESHARIMEFLWKQNKAQEVLDPVAAGLTEAEANVAHHIRVMNDNVWKMKNFNNARTLTANGFQMVRIKTAGKSKNMIGKPTNPVRTGKVWDARYGIEVDAAALDGQAGLKWFEFPTEHKVNGEIVDAQKWVCDECIATRINPYVDKTMGYIDGHVEMRFNDNARVFIRNSKGEAIAVAKDTLTAKHWMEQNLKGDPAHYSITGDKYGGDFISNQGMKQEARKGIKLINGEASDFFEDPLEAMKKGIASNADETIMQPVREQFKRDFEALYGKYFKHGTFPRSKADLSSLAPPEALQQLNWANRVLFKSVEETPWQSMMRNTAAKVIDHLAKTGDGASWIYKMADKMALERFRRGPIRALKHYTATAYIGLSPFRQLLVQGMQGLNALGVRIMSGDFNIMSSRWSDLMKHVYFGAKLDMKGKHGGFFKVMQDIGQLSQEANHSLIQEALEISNKEGMWGRFVKACGTYGAGLGEKTQQWLHGSMLYDRFVKQYGKDWHNTRKLVDEFATQLRIITGSQSQMAKTKWETALVLDSLLQFCQSPFKNSQMLFDTTLPADLRRKLFLGQAVMFGSGSLGAYSVMGAINRIDPEQKMDEGTYAVVRDGLLGAMAFAATGHAMNVNNLAPSNYSEMAMAAMDVMFGADEAVLKDMAGEGVPEYHKNKEKSIGERLGARFFNDIPMFGFWNYRLKPVAASLYGLGIDAFNKAPSDDIIKDLAELGTNILSIPSGGAGIIKAMVMANTGQYLSKKGTLLKDNMNGATTLFQAFGITPYTDREIPGHEAQADLNYRMTADKNPNSHITQAYDAVMLQMQNKYGAVKNWDSHETVARQFMAINYLANTWVNGDPEKMRALRTHVQRQLKLAANGDKNNYQWLYHLVKDEEGKVRKEQNSILYTMQTKYPAQYAEYMKISKEIEGWKPEDIDEAPVGKKASQKFEEKHGWAWKDTRKGKK